MSGPRHLLVRASAGTGKTHQLTSRYLALLFGGADPGCVLATTFTRKAAYEILDRVLARLAESARDGKKLEQLAEAVGRKVTGEECLELLARLLRGMDRIRIETIDAFFAQLARLFALDIGLPAGWRIADEAEGDQVRAEAVAGAVAGAGKLELLDLLRDLQRQAVGQSVHRRLLEFAKGGREALLESRRAAWERIEPLAAVEPRVLAAAVAALPSLRLPRTKSGKSPGSEKAHWVTNKRRLLECVEREDWPGVLELGLAQRVCAGEAQFDRVSIEPDQLEVLRPIVARALREVTEQLARQNRASRALLERHEDSYQALSRERGLLDFNDLPEALAPISGTGLVSRRGVEVDDRFDLAHRLDGRIDHLLLDEFQDTAPVQWRVLRPIADGILGDASGEKSFFCVGDVKQSIYGWRAAEPRLLRDLDAKRPNLAVEELSKSYRSSRAVIDTVNLVFAGISRNPVFTEGKGTEKTGAIAAAQEFERSFKEHESARKPGEVPPGAVCVLRARASSENGTKQGPTLELVVERVRAILADAPRATVGILMRRRMWIPELIQRLREAGIPASDEGGNPLTDSVAVLHALSLLHLADHPADLAATFHVATSPIGSRVGLSDETRSRLSAEKRPGSSTESLSGSSAESRSGSSAESLSGSSAESRSGLPVETRTGPAGNGPVDLPADTSSRPSPRKALSLSPDMPVAASSFPRSQRLADAPTEPSTGESSRQSLGAGAGLTPEDFRSIESAHSRATAVAREVRRSLAESGYGGWLTSIRPREGDGYSAWDVERFGQLIDLALAWELRAGSRPRAFVEHVRKTKVEDPSAEQVRVMTVHGAKGLEFDAVILPELDGKLAQREDRLLTMRPDPEGEIEVVTHALKKEISAAHAGLERVRVDVAQRRMVEELCVLYVAMTRAKHRLDLIVQGREEEGGGLTYAAILRGALGVEAGGAEGVAWEHPKGTKPWYRSEISAIEEFVASSADASAGVRASASERPSARAVTRGDAGAGASAGADTRAGTGAGASTRSGTRGITDADASANPGASARGGASLAANESVGASQGGRDAGMRDKELTPAGKSLRLAPSLRTRSLPGLSPSHAKDVGKVRASTLLQPHDAMTVRGRLIHRFLEEVEWIETFDRSDEELLAIGRSIETDPKTVASALAEFRAALARPVTKGVLSRQDGEVEVWRERRFALVMPGPDGKESLWAGAFDRVVIRRENGRAISAQIVDYKSDRAEGQALAERAQSYSSQMAAYREALAIITGLAVEDISTKLLFLGLDRVVAE